MAIWLPTEEDKRILQVLVDREKTGRQNIPSRSQAPDYDDFTTPDLYVAQPQNVGTGTPVDAISIPALEDGVGTAPDEPGSAVCDIYKIKMVSGTPELHLVPGLDKTVFNISRAEIEQQYIAVSRTKFGRWLAIPPGVDPFRCCLKENHPGRGIVFEVYLGNWDPSLNRFYYGTEQVNTVVNAIDWWWSDDGPYPLAGSRGWFLRYPSDAYGSIYVAWDVDCDSPGTCFDGFGTGM